MPIPMKKNGLVLGGDNTATEEEESRKYAVDTITLLDRTNFCNKILFFVHNRHDWPCIFTSEKLKT